MSYHKQFPIGRRFHAWQVLEVVEAAGGRKAYIRCLCTDCGYSESNIQPHNLRSGGTKRCASCANRKKSQPKPDESYLPSPEQIKERASRLVDEIRKASRPMELGDALKRFGYSKIKYGQTLDIYLHNKLLTSGTSQQVWDWLKERHPRFFEDET